MYVGERIRMSSANDRLQTAYSAALTAVKAEKFREAIDLLTPAIDLFVASEGERPALVKPLILLAKAIHRIESAEAAHVLLDQACAIAGVSTAMHKTFLADALCLVALVEWQNGCLQSAENTYERGIQEAERVGADSEWLAYYLSEVTDFLIDSGQSPRKALDYSTRAAALNAEKHGADSRASLFARFSLGRAQLAAGMHAEACTTFEDVLDAWLLRGPGAQRRTSGEDKFAAEVRDWIVRARDIGEKSPR
jgi:hypothetical protein